MMPLFAPKEGMLCSKISKANELGLLESAKSIKATGRPEDRETPLFSSSGEPSKPNELIFAEQSRPDLWQFLEHCWKS